MKNKSGFVDQGILFSSYILLIIDIWYFIKLYIARNGLGDRGKIEDWFGPKKLN